MSKQWFSALPKPTADIKLNKSNITITDAGLAKLSAIDNAFTSASSVLLGWDNEANAVVIAPATAGDKASFKLGKRGRSLTTRTINAASFYERFGIMLPSESLLTSSLYGDADGEAAFKIPTGIDAPKKRRGRRKKSEIEAAP